MKRALLLILLTSVLISVSAFGDSGFGVGGAFTLRFFMDDGVYPGAMATVSPPGVPFMFAAGASVVQSDWIIMLSADWWVYQGAIGKHLGIYLGPGFFLFFDDPVQLGLRFPVGFQVFPVKDLELFVEMAPNFGISVGDPVEFDVFVLLTSLGVRYWF